ncbi:hypothetical protein [Bradyrhizobium ottawaense]|uniref:hypothetical protein n=1 Tax=Bradyrhizobium ottawaense TaxID=931866 RepID=UPI001BAD235D|nr:hypothetical protein [Bradyrhizobium ottawaense]MBR1329075.1 hypothetical protein [Bradyrhizobium ottawaense]
MKHVLGLGLVLLLSSNCAVHAQFNRAASNFTLQGPAEQGGSVVKDATGKNCLDVEAAARPQTVNREMLDHVVSLKNSCSRAIKVKLCYYNSDSCKQFDVQAYKRVDTILGTMRGVSLFRYTLNQK